MNTMRYNGYSARIEVDPDAGCFVGHIVGIRSIVGFDGASVTQLRRAFHQAVDHYLAVCEERGITPEKPYSGRVMLRLPPELHARASAVAQVKGMSFNQWAGLALAQAADSNA